ncbi:MAG: hypothetical protein SGILL_002312 [Bacillariaceae sp.]
MALKHHPDKNHGDEEAAENFRLIQQAYEVLSDPQERKWYDDHREAMLAGWSTGGSPDDSAVNMIFDVVHFMHPGCYSGYHNKKGGFYQTYREVFENIVACERKQSETLVELPTDFGDADSDWDTVREFFQSWESFSSALNFAWEDKYNVHEDAPNRRVRRLMEEDNKKQRKAAKKEYNNDILQLVLFIKRRDPRVRAKTLEREKEKSEQAAKQKQDMLDRKEEQKKAKEAWRENAFRDMEQADEEDRLAGRIRLADLEDDYDYGGGKKKKKGKKKKNKRFEIPDDDADDDNDNEEVGGEVDNEFGNESWDETGKELDTSNAVEAEVDAIESLNESQDDDDAAAAAMLDEMEDEMDELGISSSEEEEEEPDVWKCECCRKTFKSRAQMENHLKSKKHREALKKFQAKPK